jgi:hypothetical protein
VSLTSITAELISRLEAPEPVRNLLCEFVESLKFSAGPNLAGIILYGGIVLGRYRNERSEINLVLLLYDTGTDKLQQISDILRRGTAEIRLEPIILTPDEVRKSADTFPIKFIHIKQHHLVVCGEDPFAGLEVKPQYVRLKVEQELRNAALLMRRTFVSLENEPLKLAEETARMLPGLLANLETLLHLSGSELPERSTFEGIAAAAGKAFQFDAAALITLDSYRENKVSGKEVLDVFGRVLASICRVAEIADAME